eukprot:SAG25_NODE_737_length_5642_cov_2.285225_5_plen_149_part_00
MIPHAAKTVTFRVEMGKSGAFGLGPTAGVTILPPTVSSSPPICGPHLAGPLKKGGIVLPQKSLDLVLRFNCQAHGLALITVRFGFKDDAFEDASFMLMKENSAAPPPTSFSSLPTGWLSLLCCVCFVAVKRGRAWVSSRKARGWWNRR